eukprot:988258-Rhodomonas_salina.1
MVKTSIVNQTLAWLCNQTKRATAEAVPRHSLMFENIPPYFMYWVLRLRFFSRRPAQSQYNPVNYLHMWSGKTRDFVSFFSPDLHGILNSKAPPGQGPQVPHWCGSQAGYALRHQQQCSGHPFQVLNEAGWAAAPHLLRTEQ